MSSSTQVFLVPTCYPSVKVSKVKIKRNQSATPSSVVCILETDSIPCIPFKSPGYGLISFVCKEGALLQAGDTLFNFEPCEHHVVMKDLCAECGANLRKEGGFCGERVATASANIPMVHMIPELHVSESVAAEIALQDENNLLSTRKLALLIDLDQTVLHTTTNPLAFKYKNVHRFRLPGCSMIYHTRFRPHLMRFLKRMVKKFQMHICTFGNRAYAHQLASILDPKRQFFCQRILSRDECFNPITKSANLKALFPRGTHLVCIIDDRDDVWEWSPNLIQVQPYRFFPEVGDINGPPGRPLSMMPMPDFGLFRSPPTSSTSSSDSESEESNGTPTRKKSSSETPVVKPDVEKQSDGADIENKPDEAGIETKSGEVNDTVKSDDAVVSSDNATVDADAVVASSKVEIESKAEEKEAKENGAIQVVKTRDPVDNVKASVFKEPFPPSNAAAASFVEAMPPSNESFFDMSEERLDSFDADYLLRLEQILLEIHQRYFRAYEMHVFKQQQGKCPNDPKKSSAVDPPVKNADGIPHVANIALQIRKRVFGPSVHITLSGLTPKHKPARHCLAGQLAIGLGATLHNRLRLPGGTGTSVGATVPCAVDIKRQMTPFWSQTPADTADSSEQYQIHRRYTTHLVACKMKTEKVIAAENFILQDPQHNRRLCIVSPRWLWACHFRWERLPESQFPLDQDYSVAMFDSDANCFPGRYRSLLKRNRYPFLPKITTLVDPLTASLSIKEEKEGAVAKLNADMVKSAIASIRKEYHSSRHHHQKSQQRQPHRSSVSVSLSERKKRKRNLSEPAPSFDVESTVTPKSAAAKRVCIRKSDGNRYSPSEPEHFTSGKKASANTKTKKSNEQEESDGEVNSESSLDSTSSLNPAKEEDFASLLNIEGGEEEALEMAADDAIISDADEDDLNSEDEDEEDKEAEEQDAAAPEPPLTPEEIQEKLKQYLPPPCPLEIAENPLLHMSPQATVEMLDEIEEAVQEEEEEKASTTPREMDHYESSSSSSSSSECGSSSSSSSERQELGYEIDAADEDNNEEDNEAIPSRRRSRLNAPDADHEERWLQIRRELLLRKPRVSGTNLNRNLATIEKRLRHIRKASGREIDNFLPFNRRRHEAGKKLVEELSREHRYYKRHYRHHRSPLCDDDDVVPVDSDLREWNTCPEGYDYSDAEKDRALLRPEIVSTTAANAGYLTSKSSSTISKKNPVIIGAASCLESELFAPVPSSDSSDEDVEAPDKEDATSDDDEDEEDDEDDNSVIKSDALKEYM